MYVCMYKFTENICTANGGKALDHSYNRSNLTMPECITIQNYLRAHKPRFNTNKILKQTKLQHNKKQINTTKNKF